MDKITRHLWISGLVQGVCYRAFAQEQAQAHGVNGWARNLADGRVEAMLSGKREAVEAMLEKLHQGPALAEVSGIELREEDYSEMSGFQIRR